MQEALRLLHFVLPHSPEDVLHLEGEEMEEASPRKSRRDNEAEKY